MKDFLNRKVVITSIISAFVLGIAIGMGVFLYKDYNDEMLRDLAMDTIQSETIGEAISEPVAENLDSAAEVEAESETTASADIVEEVIANVEVAGDVLVEEAVANEETIGDVFEEAAAEPSSLVLVNLKKQQEQMSGAPGVDLMSYRFNSDGIAVEVRNKSEVHVLANFGENVPESDDGKIYLYAMPVYVYSLSGAEEISSRNVNDKVFFSCALNHKQANTRLYSKFVLAVMRGGEMKMLHDPQFISNPEVLATATHKRADHTLKGLQGSDFWNIRLSGSINEAAADMPRFAQFICYGTDKSYVNPAAYAADSHPISHNLYMLNADNADGVSKLVNRFTYYAANSKRTDNFIIGNEVNVRTWNYMAWTGWDEYVKQYAQVFRIAYLAIKSTNANARVYLSIDQIWDKNMPTTHREHYMYMDGKDFLTSFNDIIKKNGNIDWCLAFHPYNIPLTYSKFWDPKGSGIEKYVKDMIGNNKAVTFQNMSVLTDFMQKSSMLSPNGTVRHISATELGISATQGGTNQAAAICAAYMAAKRNGYVEDVLFLSGSGDGVNSLFTSEGRDMYNNLDNPDYQAKAMETIGITDWGQVLR